MDINLDTQTVTPAQITEALLNGKSVTLRDETYSVSITCGGFNEYRVSNSNGGHVDTNSVVEALSTAADFIYAVNGEPEAPNYATWSEVTDMLAEMADV